ncbi:MAG: DUF2490 domain-containing protein [Bacteroidetes bacterium]|nr:DUF2490 domain-containing protein [Bacteroidota bacterium]
MLLNVKITFLISLICLCALGSRASTPARVTAQQSSLWLWTGAQVRLTRYFGLQTETILRFNDFQRSQQHEFHLGGDIYVGDRFVITPVAYGFFLNYPYGKFPAIGRQYEHRTWQQILYRNNWGRVGFNARIRSEENWRQRQTKDAGGEVLNNGYAFKARIRTRVQVNIALNHKTLQQPRTISLNIWEEMYAAVGPDVTYHFPEENRIQVGLGYRFNRWAVVSAGYLHQLILRNNGAQAESNHTMILSAFFQIDARKKR